MAIEPEQRCEAHVLATAAGDPENPGTWSGIPFLVTRALRELGIDISTVDGSFGAAERWMNLASGTRHLRGSKRAYGTLHPKTISATGSMSDDFRRLRTAKIEREIRNRTITHGVCFSSSRLTFPSDVHNVTLVEDMTISQVRKWRDHYRAWSAYSDEYLIQRAERQAQQQRAASLVAFLSSWAAEAAIRDYGLDRRRVAVIGVGTRFTPYSGERDWSVPRYLFVGFDWTRKHGDQVVDAFTKLRERHPTAELHLVGGHPQIDVPGVTGHGVLSLADPAAAERLRQLYVSSTCFVLPSSLEPSAVSYAEACSQGLPSIGTVHGGSEEIFGDAGIAIDPTVDGALLSAMERMADPATARAMGATAQRRAPMLTWDAVARRLALASGWWSGDAAPLTRVTPSD